MAALGVPTPFVGAGVKQDLHLLSTKFLAIESNRIRDFAEIFRESNFETILHYRVNPAEYLEFAEYLLQNSAFYFGKQDEVGSPRSLKERIFGIYTCYALYNLQPVDHVSQIPVTQSQFDELLEFQNFLIAEKMLEPLTALKGLLLKKAFRLTVFQSTYDPATHKRYLAEEEMPDFGRKPVEPFSRVKALQNHQSIGELDFIHKAYVEAKQNLGLTDIQAVDKMNPVEEIQKCLEKSQQELEALKSQIVVEAEKDVPLQPQSAGSSRSTLRTKAYTASLKHTRQRRYLDPNMEENFKHITFAQIAQECLAEEDQDRPSTSKSAPKKRRRRAAAADDLEILDDHQIAEQVLREEYASRVKPEIIEHDDDSYGGLRGNQGTAGVAKIRAPKKKNVKLIQVKTERIPSDEQPTTSEMIESSFNPSETRDLKKDTKHQIEVKPRITDEHANKLHAWNVQVKKADKQAEKWNSLLKADMADQDDANADP